MDKKYSIPEGFFNAEVRSGYLVEESMKKVWAVELDLLNVAKNVFEKYNIRWFVIGGTLLGGVRHNGFIPWDDDIDIAIPRADYIRLQSIAAEEFVEPYFFQDEYSDPGVLFGHAKLRNSNTTCISTPYLEKKHGRISFNMGIFIDLFPIDNIPDDLTQRESWLKSIREIATIAWKVRKYSHRYMPQKDVYLDSYLNRLNASHDTDMLFKIYDDILSCYRNEVTEKVCLYSLLQQDKRWEFFAEDFSDSSTIAFENLDVPIPKGFNRILTQLYGDWRIMRKLPTMHSTIGGSYFNVDKSYKCFLNPQTGGVDRDLIIKQINNKHTVY